MIAWNCNQKLFIENVFHNKVCNIVLTRIVLVNRDTESFNQFEMTASSDSLLMLISQVGLSPPFFLGRFLVGLQICVQFYLAVFVHHSYMNLK